MGELGEWFEHWELGIVNCGWLVYQILYCTVLYIPRREQNAKYCTTKTKRRPMLRCRYKLTFCPCPLSCCASTCWVAFRP